MNTHIKQRGFIWPEQIFQDIRFSLRMLRKKPGFTAVAVISLALTIGVNCGVFWLVNESLFRQVIPLRPNEVVNVYTRGTTADSGYRLFSFSEFSQLRESDEVFADVSAFQTTTVGIGAKNDEEMQWEKGYVVSDNYFSMLGVAPAMGRFFLPEESRPNAKIPVVVVSRSMWESIGGGKDFSERTLTINGETCTVVGVVPKGFKKHLRSGIDPDIWLPLGMASGDSGSMSMAIGISGQGLDSSSTFTLYLIARLHQGLSLEAARARLPVLAERLTTISVDAAEGARALEIGPLPRSGGKSTNPIYEGWKDNLFAVLAMGMAGVVLLVACLNLANMFLARNTTRSDELKVRMALGASRRRIIRILSVEGLILALMGGAAGLLISHFGITLFSGLSATPDIRVLLATFLFCVIATLIFAVAPARHAIREIVKGKLSLQHSKSTTTDRWGRLFSARHCLLMAQLALTLALLFSAGLFFRNAHSAARIDIGFAPEGDLVAEIDYSRVDRDEESVRNAITAVAEELRLLPGVRKVALASALPLGTSEGTSEKVDGVTTAGGAGKPVRPTRGTSTAISSGYFDILGIELLRGRDFTDQECLHSEGSSVVIIDQGMADALFPDEDPVGKYIQEPQMPGLDKTASQPMEIVGVVSTHWDNLEKESPPLRIFLPFAKESTKIVFVHVSGQTIDTAASVSFRKLVRSRLHSLDPDIPLVSLKPYSVILDDNTALQNFRFFAVNFGIFGAFALLLSVIGVYGVRAFVLSRRMREIGIRMALGASRRRIYALLMKQSAVQIAIGLGVGVMLSIAEGKMLASEILHVSPWDPVALGMAALFLVFAALLATWIPARRAAKVDPMEVLRWE